MDAVSLLSQQLRSAHEIVEGTVADLTAEQAQWNPAGKAIAAGPLYAHVSAAASALAGRPLDLQRRCRAVHRPRQRVGGAQRFVAACC